MAGDTVLVDPGNDDPAAAPRGPAPYQAHDGARRLRRRSAVSAREEAAPLLLVAIGRSGQRRPPRNRHRVLRAILGRLRQTADLLGCCRPALPLAEPEQTGHFLVM